MPILKYIFKKDQKPESETEPDTEIISHMPAADMPVEGEAETEVPAKEAPADDMPVADDDEPAMCQTSKHLKSYPMVKEAIDSGIIKAARGSVNPHLKPIGEWLHSQSFLKPGIETTDGVIVNGLENIEKCVPSIKTNTWNDTCETIKYPFVRTTQALVDGEAAIDNCIDNYMILPTRQFVRDGRVFYNKNLYDTKGKPLIRSSLDPIFRPINYYIEDFTLKRLPEGEPVSKNYSSEVSRNVGLIIDLVDRSIPVIEKDIIDKMMAPCNYMGHALEVYNDNLNKQVERSISSSLKATYNTSIDLTNEAINETNACWNKMKNWGSSLKNEISPVEEEEGEVEALEEPMMQQNEASPIVRSAELIPELPVSPKA